MGKHDKTFERPCILTEYIIERPNSEFFLKLGIFHGQPMIVESSQAINDLKRYLAIQFDKGFSDEEFVSYFAAACETMFDYQNDYKRNVIVLSNGTLAISTQEKFIPVQGVQKFPEMTPS